MRIPFSVPRPGSRAFDVVGLGLNSIDLVAVVGEYPAPNTKQRLQRLARHPGGQTATAIAACARLGLTAHYIGRFGDDAFGVESRTSLTSAGVCTDGSRVAVGATNQFAVVIVDGRTGERTVLWDRHPGLTMDAEGVSKDDGTSGRVLIVDCHDTAAAAQAARDLLQHVDALIAAESFPTELTGFDAPGRALEAMAREFGAPVVCVTLGKEGSLARAGGREIRTPAFRVDCVDSTGAGDAFRAGFAAGCLRSPDGDLEDVLRYANAVAALNCRALGARGGLPEPQDVERLLGRT